MQRRDYREHMVGVAGELRHGATLAERRLWNYIRAGQLDGWHFRRQHPLRGRVLDFYCDALRLAIEIDGGQHMTPAGRAADAVRSQELGEVEIIRFANHEVLADSAATTELVLWACRRRARELGVDAPGLRRRTREPRGTARG